MTDEPHRAENLTAFDRAIAEYRDVIADAGDTIRTVLSGFATWWAGRMIELIEQWQLSLMDAYRAVGAPYGDSTDGMVRWFQEQMSLVHIDPPPPDP